MEQPVERRRPESREARLHRIVDAAVDLPLPDRDRAIDLLAFGDAELARAARRAVSPDEQSTLESALAEMRGRAVVRGQDTSDTGKPVELGPYRLLERLGEGAFGEVFVAEQAESVRRRVAIKVLKPGMGSRQVVARFEAERQALALMDHPNIARIFDAGSTPLGLPYFVMELVRGVPITAYCAQHRLSLRERLALLIPVCEAVQHAHQRGIIHRDLKPGNVLVTVLDGKPVPKVIDFGIAKALGPTLTEATVYTQFRQFIGTPAYMSPEQMALSAVDVDTRSDVYSLGAMLYELVCGSPPFDAETLLRSGLDELRRVVKETDPPAPSTRVSGIDAGSRGTLASAMQVPASRLSGQLKGEVDWIVVKATERDRARRYQSPLELAADLDAFLRGRAVKAGPRSKVYLARKFARRHRVPLAIGSAVALGLMATTIATAVGLSREAAARADAVRNERIAKQNEATARAEKRNAEENARAADDALRMMTGIIASADPAHVGGRKDMSVGEMLDRLVARLDQSEAGAAPPLAPRVMLRLRSDAAGVYYWQGRVDEGQAQAAKGLALAESLYGPDSLEAARALALVVGGHWFGRGPTDEGERLARRRLSILNAHGQGDTPDAIDALHGLNLMLHAQGRSVECGEICREVIARYERMERPPVVGHATAYADLALSELARGRAESALTNIRRCIDVYGAGLDDKARAQYTSRPNATLANALLALGRLDEAEAAARKSMAISDALRGPDHPYPMYERRVLIEVLIERGKLQEAAELTALYERIQASAGAQPGLAELARRAMLLRRQGQHELALDLWQRARAELDRVRAARGGAAAPSTVGPAEIATGFGEMLGVLTDLGRAREALDAATAAHDDARAFFARSGDDFPENFRLRRVASELLRAYDTLGDEQSLAAARALRAQYPGLTAARGYPADGPR
jgi:serine/threonine protein kinase/tetratricopeptide (TPR) repeat protein